MKMSEPSYSLPVPVDVITQRDPHPHHRHRHHRHNRHHRHPHHRLRSSSLRVGRLFAAHPRRSPRVIGHRHRSSRTNTHAATHLHIHTGYIQEEEEEEEQKTRDARPLSGSTVVSSPCCPLRVPPPPPTETRGFGNDDGWMDRFSLLLGEGGEEEEEKWDDSSRMLSTPRSLATLLGSWIRGSSSPRISRRPPLIRPQAHALRHRGSRFALLVS